MSHKPSKLRYSAYYKFIFFNFQIETTMATEEEVKPAKRGRGRPPKPESEKKAAKRKVCLGFLLGCEFSVLNFSCPILIL